MSPDLSLERLAWEIEELKRWRAEVEDLGLHVVVDHVKNVRADVVALKRLALAIMITLISSSVGLAVGVLLLLAR